MSNYKHISLDGDKVQINIEQPPNSKEYDTVEEYVSDLNIWQNQCRVIPFFEGELHKLYVHLSENMWYKMDVDFMNKILYNELDETDLLDMVDICKIPPSTKEEPFEEFAFFKKTVLEDEEDLWLEAINLIKKQEYKSVQEQFTITRKSKTELLKSTNLPPISRKLKFYKEADERWYIELPEWKGSKADLEMVAGADTMLNYMAEGQDYIYLHLSEEAFDGEDKLEFVRMATEIGNGAHYIMKSYAGIEFNLEMWICDVCLFVFNNKFPENIYISKYN